MDTVDELGTRFVASTVIVSIGMGIAALLVFPEIGQRNVEFVASIGLFGMVFLLIVKSKGVDRSREETDRLHRTEDGGNR